MKDLAQELIRLANKLASQGQNEDTSYDQADIIHDNILILSRYESTKALAAKTDKLFSNLGYEFERISEYMNYYGSELHTKENKHFLSLFMDKVYFLLEELDKFPALYKEHEKMFFIDDRLRLDRDKLNRTKEELFAQNHKEFTDTYNLLNDTIAAAKGFVAKLESTDFSLEFINSNLKNIINVFKNYETNRLHHYS